LEAPPAGFGKEPRLKTFSVLSRPDRAPLIVMSAMFFDNPENVQQDWGGGWRLWPDLGSMIP